jgi:antitoxin component of RelBE/YafQ-DinJ toxin-antitoxin module
VGDIDDEIPTALVMRTNPRAVVESSSFKQLILSEVDSMLSAVLGTLELREMAVKDKKKAVSGALDAFKTYVGISLDHLGENVEVRFDDCVKSLSPKPEENIVMSDEVKVETAQALYNLDSDTIGKIVEERAEKVFEQYGVEMSNKLTSFLEAIKGIKEEATEPPKVEERVEKVDEAPSATVTVELSDELRAEIKRLEERLAKFEAEDSELSGRSSEVEDKEVIARSNQPVEANIWQGLFLK